MNRIMKDQYPLLRLYQSLRNQLLEIIDDNDLQYSPGGTNTTLGELCRRIGEVQESYRRSFLTFEQTFDPQATDLELPSDVAGLVGSYEELDQALEEAVSSLSEEKIKNQKIDRGAGFLVSPSVQIEIYKEALLIFYGKTSVYLRAMNKELPSQWLEWIE